MWNISVNKIFFIWMELSAIPYNIYGTEFTCIFRSNISTEYFSCIFGRNISVVYFGGIFLRNIWEIYSKKYYSYLVSIISTEYFTYDLPDEVCYVVPMMLVQLCGNMNFIQIHL